MTTVPPALGNRAKVLGLVGGAALGMGGAYGAQVMLPSSEHKQHLATQGVDVISDREFRANLAPASFVAAAAVGAGIGKRSSTAAITTASLGAAAMLASTGASAMINSDNEVTAGKYLRTLGVMTGIAAGGYAIGAMDEIPLNRAKVAGLGLLGFAAGALLPETAEYVLNGPAKIAESVKHRNG